MAGEMFIFFAVIFSVCIGAGTAIHAQENRKTKWWGVLVMFTGVIGLVIYAISLASD